MGLRALATDTTTGDRAAFDAWRDEVSSYFTKVQGRYITVPTDAAVDRLLINDWRSLGMIG